MTMTQHGMFIWNELITEDLATCGSFYSDLFGWERTETDAGPLGTYTVFRSADRDVAGMMKPTAKDYAGSPPPRWLGYIAVDDADAVAAKAVELGGIVHEPPNDIPGVGRIAMFSDPSGALVYVMQPAEPPAPEA
jgi:predicted enzyme related to lactoylglutathione lyase